MATTLRRPLVLVGGALREMPPGDVLSVAAGGTGETSLAGLKEALGPVVERGTGVGQSANAVKIGWSPANRLKATVDTTHIGDFAFEDSSGWNFFGSYPYPQSGGFANAVGAVYWKKMLKTVHILADMILYDKGSGGGLTSFNLPFPALRYTVFSGRELILNGKSLTGEAVDNSARVYIYNFDNSIAMASNSRMMLTGTYETAS